MIYLIAGASHTGKTQLAQNLLCQYGFPYLSLDLLKMGLIRSKNTLLTPEMDAELTRYLWPIAAEIIKTAIENRQNLTVEGSYIPFDWQKDFNADYLAEIRYCCLIFSSDYIRRHFDTVKQYANCIEQRLDDSCCTPELLTAENLHALQECRRQNLPYYLIEYSYPDFSELLASGFFS